MSNGILSSVDQSRYQPPDFNFGEIFENQFYSFSLTMVIVGWEVAFMGDLRTSILALIALTWQACGQILEITDLGTASQTTEWQNGLFPAAGAIDGDPGTFSHTDSITPNNAWQLTFEDSHPISRVELQMRGDCCGGRLSGTILRLFDEEGDSVFAEVVEDPGIGGTTVIEIPPGIDARTIRVGLENGETNPGSGIYVIHLGEVRVFSGELPKSEITSFAVSNNRIPAGRSVTLSWQTANASEVILVGDGFVEPNGQREVSPVGSSVYQLIATGEFGTVSGSVAVIVDGIPLEPRISEFMASNSETLIRSDGSSPDWIEIWNPNPFAIDLAGYQLSDQENPISVFTFPSLLLDAGQYLVVDASEIARDGVLATGFALDRSAGGFVHFRNPVAETLQLINYPRQRSDVSFGPFGDETGYFPEPSPGGINASEIVQGFVADTQFSVPRGFYSGTQTVAISSETPGVEIYYTLDGSEPGASNAEAILYSAPLEISTTTILRARGFREGFEPTDIDTVTYLFAGQVASQSSSPANFPPTWIPGLNLGIQSNPVRALSKYGFGGDVLASLPLIDSDGVGFDFEDSLEAIPTLSLVVDADELFDPVDGLHINASQRGRAWERPASIEYLDPATGSSRQANCGLRMHGGWNRFPEMLKKSFRLYFRSEYGDANFDAPLFDGAPVDEFDRLILRSGNGKAWTSPWRALSGGGNSLPRTTYFRDQFARDLQAATGQDYVPGNFVHLYINGHYWGLYNPVERPDEFLAAGHLGGDDDDYDVIKWRRGVGHQVAAGDNAGWSELISLVRGSPQNAVTYSRIQEKLDLENFVDYLLVNFFIGNQDWVDNNVYAMRNRVTNGPFRFYCWDGEESLLSVGRNSTTQNVADTCLEIHQALRNNAEYRQLFADRAYRHLFGRGALTPSKTTALVDGYAKSLDRAIVAESARWGDLHRPSDPYDRDDWLTEITNIRSNYLPSRGPTLINQLRSQGLFPNIEAPMFLPSNGGVLTFGSEVIFENNGDGSTVYYTTDGTDPRLPGGGLSTVARAFGSVIKDLVLVSLGSSWRFLDNGEDLGGSDIVEGFPSYDSRNWKHPEFDDDLWGTGLSPLGYGSITSREIATVVSYGDDVNSRHPTTYFRHRFQVDEVDDIDELVLRLFRDDGAIVYLNGVEVVRSGFDSAGNIGFATLANTTTNEGAFLEFQIPTDALVEGNNVLALEVHQGTIRSSDMGFDLELLAFKETTTSEPILIDGGTLVKARVLKDGDWSALAEALFQPEGRGEDLVVSEIMYHPPVGGAEFLEISNQGVIPHSLNDLRISGGISFLFEDSGMNQLGPGESLLLVRNADSFASAYPGVGFGGVYEGALGNGGDQFSLETVGGEILWTVSYDDEGEWPQSADGGGRSLTLRGRVPNGPEAWRPSSVENGSPGVADKSPYQDNTDPLGYAILTSGLNQYGRFEITRKLNADDARVEVESSTDLQSWSQEQIGRLSRRLDSANVIEEFHPGEGFEDRPLFFRVKVTIERP
jgi:hypothetical protein